MGVVEQKKNTHLAEKARKVSSDRTVSCDELILFNIFWLCFKTACFLKAILIWISTLSITISWISMHVGNILQ